VLDVLGLSLQHMILTQGMELYFSSLGPKMGKGSKLEIVFVNLAPRSLTGTPCIVK
jgi:hypothetical protein